MLELGGDWHRSYLEAVQELRQDGYLAGHISEVSHSTAALRACLDDVCTSRYPQLSLNLIEALLYSPGYAVLEELLQGICTNNQLHTSERQYIVRTGLPWLLLAN